MADNFDPDAYLASGSSGGFDPDAYLKGSSTPPKQDFSWGQAITDIPSEIGNEFSAGMETAGKGFELPKPGASGALENLKNTALAPTGLARAVFSPLTGAAKSLVGHGMANAEHFVGENIVNPALKMAGVDESKLQHPDSGQMYETAKEDVDKALAAARPEGAPFRTPNGWVYRYPWKAPKVTPPEPDKTPPVVSAAERISKVAPEPVQVPRAFASDSTAVQRVGQTIRNLPLVGDAIPQATGRMADQLEGAQGAIATNFGSGSGPNVANRIGTTLSNTAEAERAAAEDLANTSNQTIENAWSRHQADALNQVGNDENTALTQARAASGDMPLQDMGQQIINNLRRVHNEAQQRKTDLYNAAGQSGATVQARAAQNVHGDVTRALDDAGRLSPLTRTSLDPQLNPASNSMMQELRNLSDASRPVRDPDTGRFSRPPPISVQQLEQVRKRIGNTAQGATNDADRGAARVIMNAFDDWEERAFNSGGISGNRDALNAYREARAANRSWRQNFYNDRDEADKFINRIVTGEVTPQEVSSMLVGGGPVGAKGSSSRLLTRITQATNADPATQDALRSGVANRLFSTVEGSTPRTPEKIANDIFHFFNGEGRDVANRLFTPPQRQAAINYANALRRGQQAREDIEASGRLTKPTPMEVGPGPARDLAQAVLGKNGKTDEALFSAIDSYAKSGAKGDLKTLGDILRNIPEQEKGNLAGAIIRNLGRNNQTKGFSLDQFATDWNKYTPQAKQLLFGNAGEHRQALDDIATISQRYKEVGRRFGNPSGTGQTVGGMSELAWIIFHPYTAIPSLVGGAVAARMLAAPATAKTTAGLFRAAYNMAKSQNAGNFTRLTFALNNFKNAASNLVNNQKKRAKGGKVAEADPVDDFADEMIQDAKKFAGFAQGGQPRFSDFRKAMQDMEDRRQEDPNDPIGNFLKHDNTQVGPDTDLVTNPLSDQLGAKTLDRKLMGFADGGAPDFNDRFAGDAPSPNNFDVNSYSSSGFPQYSMVDAAHAALDTQAQRLPPTDDTEINKSLYPVGAAENPAPDDRPGWIQKLADNYNYQPWWNRVAVSGATLAGDVMAGRETYVPGLRREDVTDKPRPDGWTVSAEPNDPVIERAQDMAALAGGAGAGNAEEGAVLNATPSLRPALKYGDKIYKAPIKDPSNPVGFGAEHADAIPPNLYREFQRQAMTGEDISNFNFGFMNHKGQFLSREDALDYGIKEGLLSPHDARYGTLTSTMLSDTGKPGAAVSAMERTPYLQAAVRVGDRVYKAPPGGDHLDALSQVPPELKTQAQLDGNNRGWINDRGRFLNREKAQQYAVINNLIKENAPAWVYKAPEAVAEWIKSPVLRSDTNQQGAALSAAEHASPFYSAVERTVDNAPQAKMSGDQWANWLKNQPGVKSEELSWTGLEDFLRGQGKNPVTKQQVQQHLQQNPTDIHETVYGGKTLRRDEVAPDQIAQEQYKPEWDAKVAEIQALRPKVDDYKRELSQADWQAASDRYAQLNGHLDEIHDKMVDDTIQRMGGLGKPTRYQDYQLPGGENYREHLLTLKGDALPKEQFAKQSYETWGTNAGEWENLSPEEKQNWYDFADRNNHFNNGETYRSSHWDEPNVLAHVRTNDREMSAPYTAEETSALEARNAAQSKLAANREEQNKVARDLGTTARPLEKARQAKIMADPNLSPVQKQAALEQYVLHPDLVPFQQKLQKLREEESGMLKDLPPEPKQKSVPTLHLEEVQSDWHQAGRRQGYRPEQDKKLNDLINQRDAIVAQQNKVLNDYGVTVPTGEARTPWMELATKRDEIQNKIDELGRKDRGVPDAPFKSTQAWSELALKHMIRKAAEEGKDRISWTPGEAQAARYDLSNQIKELQYLKNDDGTYQIAGVNKDGSGFNHPDTNIPANKLPDVVGKEMAEKIVKNEGKRTRGQPSNGGYFDGVDLKVGGEGMKGFYDNMLPKIAEKIGKQYGVKVKQGSTIKEVPKDEQWMSGERAMELTGVTPEEWKKNAGSQEWRDNLFKKARDKLAEQQGAKQPVWYFDIPPQMKQDVLTKGFPLFSDTSEGAAVSGAEKASKALDMSEPARMARAKEQGFEGPWYHGGLRMDRFTQTGKIDPKRATSGPMPYFTDNPEMASAYAMGKKPDTSLQLTDEGKVSDYFTVAPKQLGLSGRTPMSVEQSWHYLPQNVKQEILSKAKRVGYQDPETASGPIVLHPEGTDATLSSDHYDWVLKHEARGNPLAALREMWHDSGELINNEPELNHIYRLAGYPHEISEANAPWTEARDVFPAMLRMKNPLDTTDAATLRDKVLPSLEKEFKNDRTRKAPYGVDMWHKTARYTPKEWVQQAKEDLAKGENSYVWTSIPDKVTNALKKMGYDGILDTGGKMGGEGHTVAIPFEPHQVRSKFAKFDPRHTNSTNMGRAHGGRVNAENIHLAPSEAQKRAGNYSKDHVNIHGLNITIENPKGGERSGVGKDGKPWSVKMPAHYGYFKRSEGSDGDHVDVYLGPHPKSSKVFIINQQDHETKKFDEHKILLGFGSLKQATDTYHKGFSDGKGPDRIGGLFEVSIDEFKAWLKNGDTSKPFSPGEAAKAVIPDTHQLGMRVAKGGSMCANCEYLADREKGLCGNKQFIIWNKGNDEIPGKIDEYCCDLYEIGK